jgi:hypothetical protein
MLFVVVFSHISLKHDYFGDENRGFALLFKPIRGVLKHEVGSFGVCLFSFSWRGERDRERERERERGGRCTTALVPDENKTCLFVLRFCFRFFAKI